MRFRRVVPAAIVVVALLSSVAGASATRIPKSASARVLTRVTTHGKTSKAKALDTSSWNSFITAAVTEGDAWNPTADGGSGYNVGGYPIAYFEPSNLVRHPNGSFTITASPGTLQPGYKWTSGVVSSYGTYSVLGGYISIEAQMPSMSDGAWPGLFLLPGPGNTKNDEIDVFEGGMTLGKDNPNYNFSGFVHNNLKTSGDTVKVRPSLSGAYHDYGVKWVPGKSLTWYLDGKQLFEVTSKQFTIPASTMELIAELEIVSPQAASWHSLPTILQNYRMNVKSIVVSPLSGPAPWSGTTSTTAG
jgi:beta-glucanase (GH16 family)